MEQRKRPAPEVIYSEPEQAIQREMRAVAAVLEAQQARLEELLRWLRALPSYRANDELRDDDFTWSVITSVAGDMSICAGHLAENVERLRDSADLTPARAAERRSEAAQREAHREAEERALRPGLAAQ